MLYSIKSEATGETMTVKFQSRLTRAELALFARILKQEKAKDEGDFTWLVKSALAIFEEEPDVLGYVASDPYAGHFVI